MKMMKGIGVEMKILFGVIIVLGLVGCGSHSESNASSICADPIEIVGEEQRELANGYLVTFDESVDVNVKSVEFLEKYADLEVYSTFSLSNVFHGNSGDQTLSEIQCEPTVESIQYDIPASPAI